jgi:signal transduction histidine kinase
MVGRVFLILVGGIIASATLTLVLAGRERQQMIAQVRSFHTARRVEQLVLTLDAIPPEVRPQLLAAGSGVGVHAEFSRPMGDPGKQDSELVAALRERLGENRPLLATQITAARCAPDAAERKRPAVCHSVFLTLRDGTPLHLIFEAPRESPAPFYQPSLLPYLLFFPTSVGVLAYGVARMSTRPLRQLAQAATALGRDIERPPLPEQGPFEVRHAAAAFNAMQARIRRHVQERTQMLAAISHDLQTPLTRLRLRLEKVQDEELRGRLVGDLAAMQEMIREGLELAGSMDSREPPQTLDLDSLLDSVCADAVDAGQDVTLNGHTGVSIVASPNTLRRCLTNIIDNAVKYGGYARVTTRREGSQVLVRVQDGGPGIPDELLETVFDPFFRLEASRSRETGGTGLGLAIARNIAEKHGGTLRLRNPPAGGLEAILELPIKR